MKKESKKSRLSFYIEQEKLDKFGIICQKLGTTMTDFMMVYVDYVIKKYWSPETERTYQLKNMRKNKQ